MSYGHPLSNPGGNQHAAIDRRIALRPRSRLLWLRSYGDWPMTDWVQPWMGTMVLTCMAAFLLGYIVAWIKDEYWNNR